VSYTLPLLSTIIPHRYIVGADLVAKILDTPLSKNDTPLLKAKDSNKNQKYSLF
jgi:hypothetical protein